MYIILSYIHIYPLESKKQMVFLVGTTQGILCVFGTDTVLWFANMPVSSWPFMTLSCDELHHYEGVYFLD